MLKRCVLSFVSCIILLLPFSYQAICETIEYDTLATQSCLAYDFKITGRIIADSTRYAGTAEFTVINNGTDTLKSPKLGFSLYETMIISSITNHSGDSLDYIGPDYFSDNSFLSSIVQINDTLAPGDTIRLNFKYQGIFDGQVSNHIEMTNSWLFHEACWYPILGDYFEVYDQLLAGPFEMAIVVPSDQIVISEGELVETIEGASTKTYVWRKEDHPFGFSTANYHKYTSIVNGTVLTVWLFNQNSEAASKMMAAMERVLKYYQETFEYNMDSYSVAEVLRRGGYGSIPMLLNSSYFTSDEPDYDMLAHEMSHPIWLSFGSQPNPLGEGIAEYSRYLFMEDQDIKTAVDMIYEGGWYTGWLVTYSKIEDEKPILETKFTDPNRTIVAYYKSPLVFHMLRFVMGDSAFIAALKEYRNYYTDEGAAPIEKFRELAEIYHGQDLSWFFDEWLWDVVIPDMLISECQIDSSGEQYITTITVKNQGTGSMPVDVMFKSDSECIIQRISMLGAGEEKTIQFTSTGRPVMLEVDPDQWLIQPNSNDIFSPYLTPETVRAVGAIDTERTEEEIMWEMIEFSQREDLSFDMSKNMWYTGYGELLIYSYTYKVSPGKIPFGGTLEDLINVSFHYDDIYAYCRVDAKFEVTNPDAYPDTNFYISANYYFNKEDGHFVFLNWGYGTGPVTPTWTEPALLTEPLTFNLEQNYPNPFSATTTIAFSLEKLTFVDLKIYDIMGRKVITLISEYKPIGRHTVIWDGTDGNGNPVPEGIFLCRMKIGNAVKTNRMILIR